MVNTLNASSINNDVNRQGWGGHLGFHVGAVLLVRMHGEQCPAVCAESKRSWQEWQAARNGGG